MDAQPAIVARYHMPTSVARETTMYDGRVHIVLPTAASSQLVSWCKAQPYVIAAEVGTIEPTSLAIYMENISQRDDESDRYIWDFLRKLGEQLGCQMDPQPVTTSHSSLECLRQQGPPTYTSEMQFLTEAHRRPGDSLPKEWPTGKSSAEQADAQTLEKKGRRRLPSWRPASPTPFAGGGSAPRPRCTWFRQTARWGGWWLETLAYGIFVVPWHRLVVAITPLRKLRRRR